MANNQTPKTLNPLCIVAEDAENGAIKHANILKLNTATAIRADIDGAHAALASLRAIQTAYRAASKAAIAADQETKAFIAAMKGAMAAAVGPFWTPLHGELGYDVQSLQQPRTQAGRSAMLVQTRDCLVRHPELADARPSVNVTAERAAALYEKLKSARAAVDAAKTAKAKCMNARDEAVQKLRQRVIGLVAELTQTIGRADDRWYAFGLTPPANPSTPATVESEVAMQPAGEGQCELSWSGARRATRYAVYVQVDGVDAEPVRVATTRDRNYLLKELPKGKTIKIAVAGVNRAGQGPMTKPVELMFPSDHLSLESESTSHAGPESVSVISYRDATLSSAC